MTHPSSPRCDLEVVARWQSLCFVTLLEKVHNRGARSSGKCEAVTMARPLWAIGWRRLMVADEKEGRTGIVQTARVPVLPSFNKDVSALLLWIHRHGSAAFRPHSFIILVAVAHLVRWWLALLAALCRGRTARPLRDRAVTPLDRACSASQPHTTHSETLTSTPDTAHSSCYWQASLTLVVSVVERDMRAARKLPRHERRRLVVHSIRLRLPKRLVELRQPAHLDVFDADRILPCLCETRSVR
jgi:hypothetical protein